MSYKNEFIAAFIRNNSDDITGDLINKAVNAYEKHIQTFMEDAFEIAFGDDAINKEYTADEVLEALRGFCENSIEETGRMYD